MTMEKMNYWISASELSIVRIFVRLLIQQHSTTISVALFLIYAKTVSSKWYFLGQMRVMDLWQKTTSRNKRETQKIAEILKEKYGTR